MLELKGITVKYGSLKAVEEVSVTVVEGSVHGVIGPNGAGKSTLMDAICGVRQLSAGRVVFDGVDVTGESVRSRRLRGLSRSFQRTNIFPGLTVREQLQLAASRFSGSKIDDVVETLSLGHLLDITATTVAYGDQRRVDIALALLGESRCILLDEPAAGLTTAETSVVFEHMTGLVRQRGLTAMVVEHDVEAVFGYCDRVTVLDLGKVLVTDTPQAVRKNPAVIKAYLGTAA